MERFCFGGHFFTHQGSHMHMCVVVCGHVTVNHLFPLEIEILLLLSDDCTEL